MYLFIYCFFWGALRAGRRPALVGLHVGLGGAGVLLGVLFGVLFGLLMCNLAAYIIYPRRAREACAGPASACA